MKEDEGVTDPMPNAPSMTMVAREIQTELQAGHTDAAHRILMDGVNRLPAAYRNGELDAVLEAPGTTGEPKWDVLLAAAVRYRLHQLGLRAPEWTFKEPLDVFWWPTRINPSQQYVAMAHSPAEFRRLGIFIDERDLSTA